MKGYGTSYAKAMGLRWRHGNIKGEDVGSSGWWIYSKTNRSYDVNVIDDEGRKSNIDIFSMDGLWTGMRPALNLNLTARDVFSYAGTVDSCREMLYDPEKTIDRSGYATIWGSPLEIVLKNSLTGKELKKYTCRIDHYRYTFNESTEISLQLSEDRREIYINPLEPEGYRVGNYYILTHNQNIFTDGGNNLDEINNYYFYVPQEVK